MRKTPPADLQHDYLNAFLSAGGASDAERRCNFVRSYYFIIYYSDISLMMEYYPDV